MILARIRLLENLYKATFWPSHGYPSVQTTSWFWPSHEIEHGGFSRLKVKTVNILSFGVVGVIESCWNIFRLHSNCCWKSSCPHHLGLRMGDWRRSIRNSVTRQDGNFWSFIVFPLCYISSLRNLGENLESEWRKMEGCDYFDDWTTGHSSSIHFLEEKQWVGLSSGIRTHIHKFMACRRRYLAVGLESGEILIYSMLSSSIEDWQVHITMHSR